MSQRTTKPTKRRATSEDSDQPAHPRSLIRVFADCIRRLQPLGYPKRDTREALPYWVDVKIDLSLILGFIVRWLNLIIFWSIVYNQVIHSQHST